MSNGVFTRLGRGGMQRNASLTLILLVKRPHSPAIKDGQGRRGAGKSFKSGASPDSLSVRRLLDGLFELVGVLNTWFGKQKIYLAGHSFGSYLGMLAVREHPELFEVYIGIGQVVDDERALALQDRFISPEYGLFDIPKVAKGSAFSSKHTKYDVIDVPVYFLMGQYDQVTPLALVEEYSEALEAPHKQIILFRRSAHFPFFEEPDSFARALKAIRDAHHRFSPIPRKRE